MLNRRGLFQGTAGLFAGGRDADRQGFADLDIQTAISRSPMAVQIEIDRMMVDRFGLRAFTPLAWPSIEGVPFQSNWHLDAICLPEDSSITTEEGPKSIGEIVRARWSGKVLSFSHRSGRAEWQHVTSWMESPGKPMTEIVTQTGHLLQCTSNHPIYVEGRGYVRADTVAEGDVVYVCDLYAAGQGKPKRSCSEVLFNDVRGFGQGQARASSNVPNLLSNICAASSSRIADFLQQKMCCKNLPNRRHGTSLPQLQETVPQQTSGNQVLFKGLQNNLAAGCSQTGCPPHRLGQGQQHGAQPRDAMQAVSRQAEGKRCAGSVCLRTVVVAAEACIRIPVRVFNIEVAGNNNYFADGILVHNCEHLQAVIDGQIRFLLIMVPPRHMKSISLAVMAPAYSWIKRPHLKWLFASYAFNLAIRDSRKCRRVMMSTWYQQRFGHCFRFVYDQNTKVRFENEHNGYRLSTSVDGQLTGEGGDIIAVDDPHNVREAESEKTREATLTWWRESMSSRLNDPKKGAYILSQQRVHANDLAGEIMAREQGWTVLCLPARYDPEHKYVYAKDPRKTAGELLWPSRYGETELQRLELALGAYAAAAQLQQLPSPREGGQFKRAWFDPWNDPLPGDMEWVRAWDLAASKAKIVKSDPDYTASVLIGWSPSAKYWIIGHAEWFRESPGQVRKRIKNRAARDEAEYGHVHIEIPQDPGQAGLDQAKSIALELAGYSVKLATVQGDKVMRSDALAGQAQIGNVMYLPDQSKTGKEAMPGEGAWNERFFSELCSFPNGSHDDLVDAATTAFNKLTGGRRGILDFYAGEVQQRILREAREAEAKRALAEGGVVMVTETTDDLGRAFFKQGNKPTDG